MTFKADLVIFDMDGTLLDTAKASVAAVWACAKRHSYPPVEADAIRRAIGWPNPEFYYMLYPSFPQDEVAAFGMDVERSEAEIVRELGASIAFPGVDAMLSRMVESGKTLYLASTGDDEHVNLCMDITGFRRHFRGVYYGEPDKSDMVRRILALHEGCCAVMIGDTVKDASAARANGIVCIGAGYGYCTADRYALFDAVADTPEELTEMVLGIAPIGHAEGMAGIPKG